MNQYQEFLSRKEKIDPATGLVDVPALNPMLRADQGVRHLSNKGH